MSDNIQLNIEPVLDLTALAKEGAEAGRKLTAAINDNSKDAGKGYETNIKKAISAYRQFEKRLTTLNSAKLKLNPEFTKFESELAVMRSGLTSLTQSFFDAKKSYEEMEATWKQETAKHTKLTYYKKDIDAARESLIALGKSVGERQRELQQLEDLAAKQSWTDKYNFEDQTATNQNRIRDLAYTVEKINDAYTAAGNSADEFAKKQADATAKAKAKAEELAQKEADKQAEAYAKATSSLQKYIDKGREETATSQQVADAISKVTNRLVELQMAGITQEGPGALTGAEINEYNRLSQTLTELQARYREVKQAEQEAVNARAWEQYAKATSALQKYIDKAREETATLDDVRNAIAQVRARMAELETMPSLTDAQRNELERLGATLTWLTQKYENLQSASSNDHWGAMRQAVDQVTSSVSKLIKKIGQLSGRAIKSAFNSARRSITGMGRDSNDTSKELQSLIRNIVKYGFGVRSIYFLYRRLRTAMVEALKDMAKFDTTGLGASIASLSSSLQYLKSAWAAAFAPIVEYVTPVLTYLMDLLANVANAIAALFATLTGKGTVVKAVKQQKSLADALGNTGSAAGGAADALGKLADFDELNIIGNDSGGGGGGGGGGGSGNGPNGSFIVETIENELADLINANKWFEIGQLFADKLNTLTEAADRWINDVFRPWGVKWATNLGNFMNGFIYHYNWELLGKTFADGINAIFDTANTWFKTVNWSWFGFRVADGLISAINNIDWTLIGETIGNKLNKTIDFLYGFVKSLFMGGRARQIADSIAEGVYSFFMTIHWDKLFETLSNGFNGIFKTLKRFIETYDWDTVGDTIANAFNTAVANLDAKEAGKTLGTFVMRVFDQLGKIDLFALGQKIGEFIASIDWPGIIGAAISNILEIAAGVISGMFNGEYGLRIAGIIAGALAVHLGVAFAKFKLGELILGKAMKGALTSAGIGTAAAGAEGAATGLSGALAGVASSAPAILGVVAAIGGVVLMCKQANDWLEDYNSKIYKIDETTQAHIDTIEELRTQTDGYHEASVRQMGVYEEENDRVRLLADSYLDLFDENGKVKEGMEERADYYYSQLANALGLEQDQLKTLVEKHGDLKTAIEEVITAKTQDRAVSAYLDEYQHALENTKTAQEAVTTAEQDHKKAVEEAQVAKEALTKAQKDYADHLGEGAEIEAEYKKKLDDATLANSNAQAAVKVTTDEVSKANDAMVKINATADFYEGYMAAIATNDTKLINAALKRMQDGFITAEEGDRESLERQVDNMEEYYNMLVEEMNKGNPNVTQEMLDDAKEWVNTADKELAKLTNLGAEAMEDLKKGMSTKKQLLITEAQRTGQSIASAYRTSLEGVLNGVNMGTPTATLPTYSYQSTSGKITPNRMGYARLATGAVLPPNDPFLAIVGDQKHGTNVEAPLSTIEDAVRNVVGDSNYSPEVVSLLQELIDVVRAKNLTLSRKEVATAVVKEINNERRRTGNTPILG